MFKSPVSKLAKFFRTSRDRWKAKYQKAKRRNKKTGIVPRSIPSDEGTDLKGGIGAFCAEHSETAASLDIAHQAAKLLKRELVAWGQNALRSLDDPRPLAGQPVDLAKLHAKLGWLTNYRDALSRMESSHDRDLHDAALRPARRLSSRRGGRLAPAADSLRNEGHAVGRRG